MNQLDTLPIESFLEKARIARKSNQKSVSLTMKEATDLADSLSVVMTRVAGDLDKILNQTAKTDSNIQINMDGGKF